MKVLDVANILIHFERARTAVLRLRGGFRQASAGNRDRDSTIPRCHNRPRRGQLEPSVSQKTRAAFRRQLLYLFMFDVGSRTDCIPIEGVPFREDYYFCGDNVAAGREEYIWPHFYHNPSQFVRGKH